MKKLLVILFFLSLLTACSGVWNSPIDKKYSHQSPELFSIYLKARNILNSYGGRHENLQKADILLRKILEKDKKFAPAYREFGRLFIMAGYKNYDNFRDGSLNSAEMTIKKSIEIEPEYADSYVLLGHLYTNMKRYDDAEEALVKAEKIGTKIPWLHLNWADLLEKQNKYDEAMKRYQLVLKKGTPNRKAYGAALSGVTTIYRYRHQYDKANEGYKKRLEFDPESAWTWGNYSNFLLFTYNDVDGAIETGEKAISIMNYGMGRFTLACALYTKWAMLLQEPNQKEHAQKYFERAWSLYPNPKKIANKTGRYKYTKITAKELLKWLAKNKIRQTT